MFMKYIYYSRFLLGKELQNMDSILDLGCSNYSTLSHLSYLNLHSKRIVGVDIFEPCIIEARKLGIHSELVCCDALNFLKSCESNSFDAIIMVDFIEHIKYRYGLKILYECERVAKKKIILITPNGYTQHDVRTLDNPYQEHISGWSASDFEHLGYTVFGSDGSKFLSRKIWNRYFRVLSYVLFTRKAYPQVCNQMIAIRKKLENI